MNTPRLHPPRSQLTTGQERDNFLQREHEQRARGDRFWGFELAAEDLSSSAGDWIALCAPGAPADAYATYEHTAGDMAQGGSADAPAVRVECNWSGFFCVRYVSIAPELIAGTAVGAPCVVIFAWIAALLESTG